MAKEVKYLIGLGETLRQQVSVNQGFGDKAHPYTFSDAVRRLSGQIDETLSVINTLPDDACPADEAVIAVTLHPTYLAKSYHPKPLFDRLGLRQVGSRERRDVTPEVSNRKQAQSTTSELFVAGPRRSLRALSPSAGFIEQDEKLQDEFRKIESVRALGNERIKSSVPDTGRIPLEVVVHIAGSNERTDDILDGFEAWCEAVDPNIELVSEREVGSLAFFNVKADAQSLRELSKFSFIRLLRRMPKLAFRQIGTRAGNLDQMISVDLSSIVSANGTVRAAIFDGGIPEDHPFGSFATPGEPGGIGAPWDEGVEHGINVTSAALFGPVQAGVTISQPFTNIDHWRVIDDVQDDFELTVTLDRIANVLSQESYDVVNLSLGPDEVLDDDDVHIWTATMDEIAAKGQTLIISAAGNNGDDDPHSGSNRIQPSADGINVLAVGARDTLRTDWNRADYSAVGPGRSPGIVKPDCIAFGGTSTEPYFAVCDPTSARGTIGTSFSAPTVMRLATGIRSTFDQLSPIAVKALLIHSSDPGSHHQCDVGWGSVQHELAEIITCADDIATVVYQGTIGIQRHVRYPIPCPLGGFENRVAVTATFVIATPVDPEDAVSYSQVGAQITFRPKTTGHPGFTDKGAEKLHPSDGFFGQSQMYQTEQELRDDAHRWESVKRHTRRFNAGTLDEPVFDIEHLVRLNGGAGKRVPDIPYALIVTIHEKGNDELYNDILSAHATLRALTPRIQIGT